MDSISKREHKAKVKPPQPRWQKTQVTMKAVRTPLVPDVHNDKKQIHIFIKSMEQHTPTYPRVFLKLLFNQQNCDLLMKGSSKVKKHKTKHNQNNGAQALISSMWRHAWVWQQSEKNHRVHSSTKVSQKTGMTPKKEKLHIVLYLKHRKPPCLGVSASIVVVLLTCQLLI